MNFSLDFNSYVKLFLKGSMQIENFHFLSLMFLARDRLEWISVISVKFAFVKLFSRLFGYLRWRQQ